MTIDYWKERYIQTQKALESTEGELRQTREALKAIINRNNTMNRPTEYRIIRNGSFMNYVFNTFEEAKDHADFIQNQSALSREWNLEITTKREPGDPLYNKELDSF